jgi:NAD(P)-dependent dehydrogenase (short-subunit alcohol dehydrogenase family)
MSHVAFITGANRGIGLQTAKELAARGYRVILGVRSESAGQEAAQQVGHGSEFVVIDVADSESISRAAEDITGRIEQLDVLINNAGIYPDEGVSILDSTREQLVETFQTNTFGPIVVAQAFLHLLKRSPRGRIINMSSGYGQLGGLSADVPSYCLSKLALNGVTLMLADKLRGDGIAVNSVCPGWVRTDMGGAGATRSVEEGAAGIVWLAADAPQELTGKFVRDGEEISY